MKKFLMGVLAFATLSAFAAPRNLDEIIPTRTESDCVKPGIFADEPCYPETILKLMDYVDQKVEEHSSKQTASVDPLAYGESSVTVSEGFSIVGDYLKSTDHTNLDDADWAGGAPDTVWEALDRLAKAYNASHTGPVP